MALKPRSWPAIETPEGQGSTKGLQFSAMDDLKQKQHTASSLVRVVFSSFIGTTVEWYDFFLYGTASALVFNKLFFPKLDPLTGTMASYGTFAVGFVARPIGGMVFGHFGDRLGRKSMLIVS